MPWVWYDKNVDGDAWVGIYQAAVLLGRSESFVRSMIARGDLQTKTVDFGNRDGRVLIRFRDVSAWKQCPAMMDMRGA